MRYGEMTNCPCLRSQRANRSCLPMTGHSNNAPVVHTETEPFEIRRRRELLADLKLWDAGISSLTDSIRAARMESGYYVQTALSTGAMSLRLRTLLSGLNQLSRWHSDTLAALAQL